MNVKANTTAAAQAKKPRKKVKRTVAVTANNRVQKIKAVQYQALRDKMSGIAYINQMDEAMKQLDSELSSLKKKKVLGDGERNLIDIKIKIIREKINLNLRRLKFVLPELRAITLEDGEGRNPFEKLGETIADITKNLLN